MSNYTVDGIPVNYGPYGQTITTEQNILSVLQSINLQLNTIIRILEKMEKNLKA